MHPLQTLIALEADAQQYGFDWENVHMILDQVESECREIREDLAAKAPAAKLQEEIGDLIHAALEVCLFCGFSIEDTLDKTNQKFAKRMSALKEVAQARGLDHLRGKSMDFLMDLWKQAKDLTKVSENTI